MRLRTLAILACLAASVGVPAMALAQSGPAGKAPPAPAGRDSKPEAEDDGPALPTALPEGAELPAVAKPASARADSMAGRITALDRSLACTKCAGKGFLVVRTRQSRGVFREPFITESFDDCPMCHGLGHTPTARRVSLPLDGVAGALAGIPMDLPTAPTLIERARKALVRVGATGEFAVAITADDRNAFSVGRHGKPGSPVAVTGFVGKSFSVGRGVRVYPVLVDGRAVALMRNPVIHCAADRGEALVGGILAGPVEDIEWDFGPAAVIDGGFLVPLEPAQKLPKPEPKEKPER